MVLHTCIKCLKVFDKKSNFIMHTEHRKRPCKNTHELVAPTLHLDQKTAPTLVILAPEMTKKLNIENNIEKPGLMIIENKIIPDVDIVQKLEENVKNNCENNCNFCKKTFVRLYGLNRHLTRCNIKKIKDDELKKEAESLKNKNEEIEKLKNENEKIKSENEKLKNEQLKHDKLTNNGIINITNNNVITNNNIKLDIVNYREEDLTKLDLKKILTYDNSFIEMVFRDIHCNPELPENQNILLPSLSRYDIYIKLNNEWLKRNKNEILKERYSTIREHIMELYTEESEKNKKTADQMYFHFLKQIKLVDPTNTVYKPQEEKKIIDGIANVLYNHKDNIKSVIKTSLIPKKKTLT